MNVTRAQTNCTSFDSGDAAGAPAYAVAGTPPSTCYALGHLATNPTVAAYTAAATATATAAAAVPTADGAGVDAGVVTVGVDADADVGIEITYSGGVGSRAVTYRLICDASLPITSGPVIDPFKTPNLFF